MQIYAEGENRSDVGPAVPQAVHTTPYKVHKWYLKYLTMLLHDFKSFFHNFVDPYQILGPTSSRLANPGEKGFC